MRKYLTAFFIFSLITIYAQDIEFEGYAFENNNRGFLNAVKVTVIEKESGQVMESVFSNMEGFFSFSLPIDKSFTLVGEKELFHPTKQELSTHNIDPDKKQFVKLRLERSPGYAFDVTLANARTDQDSVVDAIEGAWIEIYNNTTNEEELNLKDYPDPNFQYTFQQGNHYTVLIRKDGYFTKRLEAYVNVEGCILCFEGIDDLTNVTDNLTMGLQMGVILANVELYKAEIGNKFTVDNIYYDYNSAKLRPESKKELEELSTILKDNPNIIVELGSHTDARGDKKYNSELSFRRAKAAVDYLLENDIKSNRIIARGYGESDLFNDCKDGVDCTEEEHQENRRTEIKVTGFLEDNPLQNRTLKDLKFDENFDEIIKKLEEGGQVRIDENTVVDDKLKQEIAQQTGDTTILQDHVIIQESFIDLSAYDHRPSDQTSEENVIEMNDSVVIIDESGVSGMKEGTFEVTDENLETIKESGELEAPVDPGQFTFPRPIKNIDNQFNAYSVFVDKYLDVESIDFTKFEKISTMLVKEHENNEVSVFVGDYKTIYSANNLLNSLKEKFPNAKLVVFENGEIVN